MINAFSPISANSFQSGHAIVDEYHVLSDRLNGHKTDDPIDVSIDARERSHTCYNAHARARTPLNGPGEHRIDLDQVIPAELYNGISGVDVGQFPDGTWLARAGFYQIRYTEQNGVIKKEVLEQSLLKSAGASRTTYIVDASAPSQVQEFRTQA